jgi:GNAT superfamily N-acetyltransferase
MEIFEFVPDRGRRAELEDHHRLKVAAIRVDHPGDPEPTFEMATGWLFTPLPYFGRCRYMSARSDGVMVGLLTIGFPDDENDHLAVAEIVVHPEWRGQGVEDALLKAALPVIAEQQRSTVSFQGVTEGSAVDTWARGVGFTVVHRDLLQRLDFARADPANWDVSTPAGYHARQWVGAVPEELLASYARVRSAMKDQPQQDWSVQWPQWTPDRVRQEEDQLRRQGIELLVVAAVHDAMDEVAGITEILLYPHRRERAIQGNTAVVPEHRGHGLGLYAKATMMRWLRAERPLVTEAMASNADDNVYMININKQLGYCVRRSMVSLDMGLEELSAQLGV